MGSHEHISAGRKECIHRALLHAPQTWAQMGSVPGWRGAAAPAASAARCWQSCTDCMGNMSTTAVHCAAGMHCSGCHPAAVHSRAQPHACPALPAPPTCSAVSCRRSAGWRRQRRSARFASTPVPEHGASSSTRSNWECSSAAAFAAGPSPPRPAWPPAAAACAGAAATGPASPLSAAAPSCCRWSGCCCCCCASRRCRRRSAWASRAMSQTSPPVATASCAPAAAAAAATAAAPEGPFPKARKSAASVATIPP